MKNTFFILILILITFSCTESKQLENITEDKENLQTQIDSLKILINSNKANVKEKITTFLTFQENNAEEAMNYYVELFNNSEIIDIQRHGKGTPAKEGSLMKATFKLNGKTFICSDSYIKHEWTFSPAISMFVECKTEIELQSLFDNLSQNGNVFMEINNYGFSEKFAWVEDRFGISWQLNFN